MSINPIPLAILKAVLFKGAIIVFARIEMWESTMVSPLDCNASNAMMAIFSPKALAFLKVGSAYSAPVNNGDEMVWWGAINPPMAPEK